MGAASDDIYDPHLGIMEEGVYQDNGSMTNVTIGASVDTIDIYAFVGHPLQSVTVMTPVPPVLKVGTAVSNTTVFDTNNFGTTILYVPQVMVNRYRTAHEWELFTHIEGIQVKGNGDSNGNGQVDISDVSTLIDELLESGSTATFNCPITHPTTTTNQSPAAHYSHGTLVYPTLPACLDREGEDLSYSK